MSFKDIARPLIERGIKVIPVQPGEKRCLLPYWPKEATTDLAQILVWYAQNPDYNVGCVGTPDGIVILDCDVVGLREKIEKETGHKFPATYIVKSAGKGAEHIYFKQTDRSRALDNRSSPGLYDLQSNNKYVVGAGSKLSNGREYTVVDGSPIADFPDWLAEWVERTSVQERHAADVGDGEIGAPVHEDFHFDAFCEHYELEFLGEKAGKWVFQQCPFKGDHHNTSDGSPDFQATVLFFDGEGIGFSCLATSCEGHGKGIGGLIRFLNQEHGRYDGPIFEQDDIEETMAAFGIEFEEADPMPETCEPMPQVTKDYLRRNAEKAFAAEKNATFEGSTPEPEPSTPEPESDPIPGDNSHVIAEGKLGDTIYSMVTIRADQVKAETLEWLWQDRIPLGKITFMAGKQDCGKSVTMIDIVARVSAGRDFPDAPNPWGERKVLLGVSEDGVADTVKPRLIAAGAKLENIEILKLVRASKGDSKKKRAFGLKTDMKLLRHTLKKNPDIALVALDPITGYFGDVDSTKDKDIRPVMDELSAICDETRVTFLAVSHQSKRTDVSAVQKVLGASSVAGSARTVWGFSRDAEDKSLCHMSLIKNNLTAKRSGLDYKIVSAPVEIDGKTVSHAVIEWGEENEMSADELDAKERKLKRDAEKGDSHSQRGNAKDFLVKNLQRGNDKICELIDLAQADGISRATLYRAATELGLESVGGKPKRWRFPGDTGYQEMASSETVPEPEHVF